MCIQWESTFSESFTVANGVHQGGVLSPILFILYIDDLLMDLKNQSVGCSWKLFLLTLMTYLYLQLLCQH